MGACSSLTCKTGSPNISPASSQNPLPLPSPGTKHDTKTTLEETTGKVHTIKAKQLKEPEGQNHTGNEEVEEKSDTESADISRKASGSQSSLKNFAKRQEFFRSIETSGDNQDKQVEGITPGDSETHDTESQGEKGEIEIPISVIDETDSDTSEILRALSELDQALPTSSEENVCDQISEKGSVDDLKENEKQSAQLEKSAEFNQYVEHIVDDIVKEASDQFLLESKSSPISVDIESLGITLPEEDVQAEDKVQEAGNKCKLIKDTSSETKEVCLEETDVAEIPVKECEDQSLKQAESVDKQLEKLNNFVDEFVNETVNAALATNLAQTSPSEELPVDGEDIKQTVGEIKQNIDLDIIDINLPPSAENVSPKYQVEDTGNEGTGLPVTNEVASIVFTSEEHTFPKVDQVLEDKEVSCEPPFQARSAERSVEESTLELQTLNNFVDTLVEDTIRKASEEVRIVSQASPHKQDLESLDVTLLSEDNIEAEKLEEIEDTIRKVSEGHKEKSKSLFPVIIGENTASLQGKGVSISPATEGASGINTEVAPKFEPTIKSVETETATADIDQAPAAQHVSVEPQPSTSPSEPNMFSINHAVSAPSAAVAGQAAESAAGKATVEADVKPPTSAPAGDVQAVKQPSEQKSPEEPPAAAPASTPAAPPSSTPAVPPTSAAAPAPAPALATSGVEVAKPASGAETFSPAKDAETTQAAQKSSEQKSATEPSVVTTPSQPAAAEPQAAEPTAAPETALAAPPVSVPEKAPPATVTAPPADAPKPAPQAEISPISTTSLNAASTTPSQPVLPDDKPVPASTEAADATVKPVEKSKTTSDKADPVPASVAVEAPAKEKPAESVQESEPAAGATASPEAEGAAEKKAVAPLDFHKLKQYNLLLKLQKEMAIMQVRLSQLQDCMRAATHAFTEVMDHNQDIVDNL